MAKERIGNPITTGQSGAYGFYSEGGDYLLEISGPQLETKSIKVTLPTPPGGTIVTKVKDSRGILAFSVTLVASLTPEIAAQSASLLRLEKTQSGGAGSGGGRVPPAEPASALVRTANGRQLGGTQNLGWFDVTQFGAVADGVTDCGDAVVAASNAAIAQGGGTVYFPPNGTPKGLKGTYFVGHEITLPGTNSGYVTWMLGAGLIVNGTIHLNSRYAIIGGAAQGDGEATPFSPEPKTVIFGSANPIFEAYDLSNITLKNLIIATTGTSQTNMVFDGLNGGCVGVVFDNVTSMIENDPTGTPLAIRGGFGFTFKGGSYQGANSPNAQGGSILFTTNTDGTRQLPYLVSITDTTLLLQGIKVDGSAGYGTGGGLFVIRNVLYESGNSPFMTTISQSGMTGFDLEEDYTADQQVATPFIRSIGAGLSDVVLNAVLPGAPGLAYVQVDNPINDLVIHGRIPGNPIGQQSNYTADEFTSEHGADILLAMPEHVPVGAQPSTSIFFDMAPPSNLVATLAPGGSLTPGETLYFVVTATDGESTNDETLPSNEASITPMNGYQTVVLTWSNPTGASNNCFVYEGLAPGKEYVRPVIADFPVPCGKFVDGSPAVTGSRSVPTADLAAVARESAAVDFTMAKTTLGATTIAPAGVELNVVGGSVEMPSAIIGGESLSASPRAVLSGFAAGSLTNQGVIATFNPDKPITVTRVQVTSRTEPLGCNSNADIRVAGDQLVDLVVASGLTDPGPLNLNMGTTTPVQIILQSPASGCEVYPQDANILVEFRTQ